MCLPHTAICPVAVKKNDGRVTKRAALMDKHRLFLPNRCNTRKNSIGSSLIGAIFPLQNNRQVELVSYYLGVNHGETLWTWQGKSRQTVLF
jgi:hypothetical protein